MKRECEFYSEEHSPLPTYPPTPPWRMLSHEATGETIH